MKAFKIKRYLGTLFAALTLSVASLGAQAAYDEYSFSGVQTAANGLGAVGATLGAFFIADDLGADGTLGANAGAGLVGDFDENFNYNGFAARTATRFALLNPTPQFPGLENGNVTASTLTVDGLGNITGGTFTIAANVPGGGTDGSLFINADAGTWALSALGDVRASGTGSFALIASPPPPTPPGVGISSGKSIPVMPPFMMVLSGLGLLLLARRHLKS